MGGSYERITVEEKNGVQIVRFRESDILDQINIQEIGEEMYSVVESTPNVKLVVDFRGVEYLSSTALGKLITLRRKVNEVSERLKLCNIAPETFQVFVVSHLDTFFDIHHDEQTALRSF